MSSIQDFLQLLGNEGVGGGVGQIEIENNNGVLTTVPIITNNNNATASTVLEVNYQILPEGFGSYLEGILPSDIATAAGAFSATMQQVKNIRKIDIEKFAQVVTSLETTEGLPLVNGTNVPTDTIEAQSALDLIALGTGPHGTYTFSDFFGCMSGLPYDWVSLQTAITNMPTDNLATLYSNLYTATQGPTLGLDAAVQAQIDLINAKIAVILTTNPGQSIELNNLYSATATQLNNEQRARDIGLGSIPTPRTPGKNGDLFPYPTMVYSFTDLLPTYAKLTDPNLASQNLEAISDLTLTAGQSVVAAMRAERNQARLIEVGITPDDNIPDTLSPTEQVILLSNGTVANSVPSYPYDTIPLGVYDPETQNYVTPTGIIGVPNSSVAAVLGIGTIDGLPVPSPDIGIGTPGISQVSVPPGTPFFSGSGAGGGQGSQGGGPIVPGSLAGSPYTKLIPPALNPVYTSNVLLPASISVAQAIDQVITCNCDCWVQ